MNIAWWMLLAMLVLAFAVIFSIIALWRQRVVNPVAVLSTKTYTIGGRPYVLKQLRIQAYPKTHGILQITGDGVSISFHSGTGPFSEVVAGNTIRFGGHTFEMQAAPNEYQIDGITHVLARGARYVFSNGAYITQLST